MSRILIVDDEASICWAFREFLSDEGHEVEVASSAEEGLKLAEGGSLDAVVLDVRLPGIDGLTAIRQFQSRIGSAPIVIMTAFGSLDTAVRAMEGGAFDYLVKPFGLDQAGTVVKRALERREVRDTPLAETETGDILIGSSLAMQELFKSIALVAPTDVPVFITGESGTGKELVARAIHRHSRRRGGPFLPICLAALSPSLIERELFGHEKGSFTGASHDRKGLLELANGGTLLLDEIGDVPSNLQVKILRAIEHHEVTPVGDARPRSVDIRVVAATNRPLGELMASGQFREDLFFRLSVFQIHLPPLRERREDIPALAAHFLRESHVPHASEIELTDAAIEALRSRPWVGNVRELRNTIEHAAIVARGRALHPDHLPPPPAETAIGSTTDSLDAMLADWASREATQALTQSSEANLYERFLELTEPAVLRAVWKACRENRAGAAEMLGMHRATLRQKMKRYGIG